MVEVLFQTIIGHMIDIENFHNKVNEIYIFSYVTYKLVGDFGGKKIFQYGKHF